MCPSHSYRAAVRLWLFRQVWVHRFGGIALDNILLGNSEEGADAVAKTSFLVRADKNQRGNEKIHPAHDD